MIPQGLRRECGNCRHRYQARTGDQATLYHTCHEGPPVMLTEADGVTLRTWFPIIQDVMFCNHFRFTRGKALAIYATTFAGLSAVAALAYHYLG